MPKSKDGVALFEIMRKIEPDGKDTGAGGRSGVSERETAPTPLPPRRAEPSGPRRLAGRDRPAGRDNGTADLPVVEMAGGRLQLALTSRATAVVVFALGVLLVAAYWAGLMVGRERGEAAGFEEGRAFAQASAVDEIQTARAQRPAQGLFEGIGADPVQAAETVVSEGPTEDRVTRTQPEVAWVRGYTYIAVQDFRADAQADVERARRYLLDNGIETAVVELEGDWKYCLVTTQGFNRDDPVQRDLADEHLATIRKLGQAYFKAGGDYRLEGYFKKLTTETW